MTFQKFRTDFFIGVARFIALLPRALILAIGRLIGYLIWLIPNKRKNIALRNIKLCFNNLTNREQNKLLKSNLISTGVGFSEMLIAYWSSDAKFINRFEYLGIEHVERALENGKGCILMSCHLHAMELATRAINLKLNQPSFILGRQHNNKVFEGHIDKARTIHCEKTIDKKDLRSVLKALKNNRCIFYIPDQNFSYQCEYIEFFNQPAATVVAPVRITQSSGACVVPWFCFRKNNKWVIQFLPALDYFHQKDIPASLLKMNQLFEQQIKKHPEQYLWVHRRFKNHPKGKNFLYKNL